MAARSSAWGGRAGLPRERDRRRGLIQAHGRRPQGHGRHHRRPPAQPLDAITALRAGGEPPSSRPADAAPRSRPNAGSLRSCSPTGSAPQPSARLHPEELREVLRAYQDAAAGAVIRFGGHVAKFMGDGVLADFGRPQAHEDDAERAVWAGLTVLSAVRVQRTPAAEPLTARVGSRPGSRWSATSWARARRGRRPWSAIPDLAARALRPSPTGRGGDRAFHPPPGRAALRARDARAARAQGPRRAASRPSASVARVGGEPLRGPSGDAVAPLIGRERERSFSSTSGGRPGPGRVMRRCFRASPGSASPASSRPCARRPAAKDARACATRPRPTTPAVRSGR